MMHIELQKWQRSVPGINAGRVIEKDFQKIEVVDEFSREKCVLARNSDAARVILKVLVKRGLY